MKRKGLRAETERGGGKRHRKDSGHGRRDSFTASGHAPTATAAPVQEKGTLPTSAALCSTSVIPPARFSRSGEGTGTGSAAGSAGNGDAAAGTPCLSLPPLLNPRHPNDSENPLPYTARFNNVNAANTLHCHSFKLGWGFCSALRARTPPEALSSLLCGIITLLF